MADLVVPYVQLTNALQTFLLAPTSTILKWYSNNYTPDKNAVLANYIQAVDPVTGLDLKWTLAQGNWGFGTDADGSWGKQPQIAQLINGPLTIYGYWIEDNAGNYMYGQRWDGAPIVFPAGLTAVIFIPEIHCESP